MAKRADAEGNPLYPVPRLMDARELERMYHRVQEREPAPAARAMRTAREIQPVRRSPIHLASRTVRIACVAAHRAARRVRRRIRVHR